MPDTDFFDDCQFNYVLAGHNGCHEYHLVDTRPYEHGGTVYVLEHNDDCEFDIDDGSAAS